MEELKQRLNDPETAFNESLEDEVMLSNDPEIFLIALSRQDCTKSLIINLFQAPSDAVRLKIAKHPSTPVSVLKKLAEDRNQEVSQSAREKLKNG